jgi:hypothetical protein
MPVHQEAGIPDALHTTPTMNLCDCVTPSVSICSQLDAWDCNVPPHHGISDIGQ